MTHAADRTAASHARTALLVACGFTFALLLWDLFAAPAYRGEIGWETKGNLPNPTVTYIKPGYPADRAGLRVGDTISFGDTIAERIKIGGGPWIAGQLVSFHVRRSGKQLSITVMPIATPRGD